MNQKHRETAIDANFKHSLTEIRSTSMVSLITNVALIKWFHICGTHNKMVSLCGKMWHSCGKLDTL